LPDPAPLLSIPEAPAPDGRAEWFEGARGAKLRAAVFPAPSPRGSVVLSTGRTEPLEKYFEVVRELTGRGFTVLTHDWRGQGASARLLPDHLLGHAENVEDFLTDYDALLKRFGSELPRPWVAMGHSMGGCLTLLALEDGQPFEAGILSAPMLCVRVPGSQRFMQWTAWLQVKLGRASKPVPGRAGDPLQDVFETNRLTHDAVRYRRYLAQLKAQPDLALGHPTWGWLNFAMQATRKVREPANLKKATLPITVLGAGADKIIDTSVTARAAAGLSNACYIEVPGSFHEILMEVDERRAVFWRAFDEMAARLG
jgi:lysophospholipase